MDINIVVDGVLYKLKTLADYWDPTTETCPVIDVIFVSSSEYLCLF